MPAPPFPPAGHPSSPGACPHRRCPSRGPQGTRHLAHRAWTGQDQPLERWRGQACGPECSARRRARRPNGARARAGAGLPAPPSRPPRAPPQAGRGAPARAVLWPGRHGTPGPGHAPAGRRPGGRRRSPPRRAGEGLSGAAALPPPRLQGALGWPPARSVGPLAPTPPRPRRASAPAPGTALVGGRARQRCAAPEELTPAGPAAHPPDGHRGRRPGVERSGLSLVSRASGSSRPPADAAAREGTVGSGSRGWMTPVTFLQDYQNII